MADSKPTNRRPRQSHHPEPKTPIPHNMIPTNRDVNPAHLPQPPAPPAHREASHGSSLLQERLRDRKVESVRHDRWRSDEGTSQTQSSPIHGPRRRDDRRPSSSGVTTSKEMGVKQIADQVSTLHKQNFDLKLEVHHRRERQKVLERRLEAAEKQVEEIQELNEQLVAELEKRDQAVEEAVGIIVNLEDQLDQLKEACGTHVLEQREDSYFERRHSGPPSSPPEFAVSKPGATGSEPRPRAIPRMPSFLSENSEGAGALRSLYLPHRNTDPSLPKLPEDTVDGMDSPRLSVLSESSFLSVYGDRHLSLGERADQPEEPTSVRKRTTSSVEKWIDTRPTVAATPSPTSRKSSTIGSQYLSINGILDSPLQRLEKLTTKLEKRSEKQHQIYQQDPPTDLRPTEPARRGTDHQNFDKQHPLPPTPDTISTGTLRHYQNSDETLGYEKKRGALSKQPPHLDSRRFDDSLHATLPPRPRSACETVTSRRDGHGWDTDTQEDFEDSSTASLRSPHMASGSGRVLTPNLFTFGDYNDGGWGRDIMFGNGPALPPPVSRHVSGYDTDARRAPLLDPPRGSGAAEVPSNPAARLHAAGPAAVSSSVPARRSSLSATNKLRKLSATPSLGHDVNGNATPSPSATHHDSGKKPRLLSGRFFGRSETSPTAPTIQSRPVPASIPNVGGNEARLVSREDIYDRDYETATPPPIRRSRTFQPAYRPTSAGGMAADFRGDLSPFYKHDGAGVDGDRNGQVETPGGTEPAKSGPRKWFGRANSRRT